jgi:hypothetical protein
MAIYRGSAPRDRTRLTGRLAPFLKYWPEVYCPVYLKPWAPKGLRAILPTESHGADRDAAVAQSPKKEQ